MSVCVSSSRSSVPASVQRRRSASWKPGSGMTTPSLVSAGSLKRRRTRGWPERRPARRTSLNCTTSMSRAGVRGQAEVREPSLAGEGGEHLVAVAAVVAGEGEDPLPARRVPGEAQGLGVGLRRGQRELPGRQTPATREFFGHHDGVLGGKHELRAVGHTLLHGAHHRLGVDAAEGALVADVGVEEPDAVGAGEVGAVPLVDPDRRMREVAHHPAHRHAVRHVGAALLAQFQAAWVLALVLRDLALPESCYQCRIYACPSIHPADAISWGRPARRRCLRAELGPLAGDDAPVGALMDGPSQAARIRLLRAWCSTSASPRASSTGGT